MVYQSDCRYLPYSTHFSEFMPIFSQEKAQNYLKAAIFIGYENGRQRLLGAQSITTERAFLKCELWTQWCRVCHVGFRFRRLMPVVLLVPCLLLLLTFFISDVIHINSVKDLVSCIHYWNSLFSNQKQLYLCLLHPSRLPTQTVLFKIPLSQPLESTPWVNPLSQPLESTLFSSTEQTSFMDALFRRTCWHSPTLLRMVNDSHKPMLGLPSFLFSASRRFLSSLLSNIHF